MSSRIDTTEFSADREKRTRVLEQANACIQAVLRVIAYLCSSGSEGYIDDDAILGSRGQTLTPYC